MASNVPDFSRLTFKEAFSAARKDGGKEFSWNGKRYNTELADENTAGKAAEPKAKADDIDLKKESKNWETYGKSANAKLRADVEVADKPLESSHPELMLLGGPLAKAAGKAAIKAVTRGVTAVKKYADERAAAREPAERIEPHLSKNWRNEKDITPKPERLEAPRKQLEYETYKRGGMVKSSASRRGDGIAQRGKTKGRIV